MHPNSNARQKYQTGIMVGPIYNSGWEKAGMKVTIIRGSEIRLYLSIFETKGSKAQVGDAMMILWVDWFVPKSSMGVFKICVQTSEAESMCPSYSPVPVLRATA